MTVHRAKSNTRLDERALTEAAKELGCTVPAKVFGERFVIAYLATTPAPVGEEERG